MKSDPEVKRIHTTLSNGQHAAMYVSLSSPEDECTAHYIGFCIGNTRRQCNDWWNGRLNRHAKAVNLRSTGKCGVEGLRWALKQILALEEELKIHPVCSDWDAIVIGAADKHRATAYKWMKRHGYFEAVHGGDDVLIKIINHA